MSYAQETAMSPRQTTLGVGIEENSRTLFELKSRLLRLKEVIVGIEPTKEPVDGSSAINLSQHQIQQARILRDCLQIADRLLNEVSTKNQ